MNDRINLIIRADADSVIGTGHIMRCLALTQVWQDKGGKVTFAGKIDNDDHRNIAESAKKILITMGGSDSY